MFFPNKQLCFLVVGLLVWIPLLFVPESGFAAKKNTEKDSFVMNEAELQSEIMGFADQFTAIVGQAIEDYDDKSPSPRNRRVVINDIVYAMASAYIIATEADPDTALLDMVVMVTLGRIVYEDFYQKKWGSEIHPIIHGFRTAEIEIWEIAAKILNAAQQQELRSTINLWRKNHPDINVFFQIRFNDFAAERRKSKLSRSENQSGIFKSVENATQQVEEMRLLAERGMFLATRMPMLSGLFADAWLSQLLVNPDVSGILLDISKFSTVSERLATVAEGLPDKISKERQTTIKQVMKEVDTLSQTTLDRVMAKVEIERKAAVRQIVEEFSNEQKKVIQGFIAEEERVRGVLTELRQTLTSGNDLLLTTNLLLEKFEEDTPSDDPSRPFDIMEYRDTLTEVSHTVQELNALVNSTNQLVAAVGLDQLLPMIVEAIDQAEDEGRNIVDHSFRQAILLIIIWMVGYTLARVIIHFVTKRRVQSVSDI